MKLYNIRNVALAVAIIVYLVWYTQLEQPSEFAASVSSYVEDYVSRGRLAVDDYAVRAQTQLETSLKTLFDELDTDRDGCIRKDEFRGVSLGMVAAVRSLGVQVPTLETLEMPPVESISILRRVVGLQLMFLVALYVMEHLKNFVMLRASTSFNKSLYDKSYINSKPPHASVAQALEYDTPITAFERAKMIFFFCTGLLFLRMVLAVVFFTCGILCINAGVMGGRTRHRNPLWFHFFGSLTKIFGYLALAAMGFYDIRTIGQPAGPKEAPIIIGNHICMIELIVLFLQADFPAFVSRVENLEIPLFRGIVKSANAIIVDRDAASSRSATLNEIVRRAHSDDGTQVMLFPEGTCNSQQALFKFKRGAFEAGEPVQMVCFRVPYRNFNPCWSGRPAGGNDMPDILIRLFSQFVNHIEIVYLPVYTPTAEERRDTAKFSKHCQEMMATVLNSRTSDAEFKDYVEAAKVYNKKKRSDLHVIGMSESTTPVPRSISPSLNNSLDSLDGASPDWKKAQ